MPISLPSNVFDNVNTSNCELRVPSGTEDLYKVFDVWKDFNIVPSSSASLLVSPASLDFVAAGGQQTFNITSDISWTATVDAAWATLSATSGSNNGTITVTADANTAATSRTATITVSGAGVAAQTITITQAASSTPSLSVNPVVLGFVAAGGQETLNIISNVSWTATVDAAWATLSVASGSNSGAVTVTADANTTSMPRSTTITISGAGVAAQTVTVVQVGATAALTVSPASLSFAAGGGAQNVTLTTNGAWTAASDASWLTVSPAFGAADGTASVVAAINTTTSPRSANIVFTNGNATQTVSVSQAAAQPPSGGDGSQGVVITTDGVTVGEMEVSLNIPTNATFTISFLITLPQGFILDLTATALDPSLSNNYKLEITPVAANKWRFDIIPNPLSTRSGMETKDILRLVYYPDPSASSGDYDITFSDMNLVLADGQVIHQDEVNVSVYISTGNENVSGVSISYSDGILKVNTPVSEQINVYSASGALQFSVVKTSGEAVYNLSRLPSGILIARGSSGWTRKLVVKP
jgi:hypothetical protein